ncbi:MAG: pilus assembly protein PilM [Kiritimatiellae bacterium]|nr:pilus assembly protein PilM [Kiritimatiellia bacterium]
MGLDIGADQVSMAQVEVRGANRLYLKNAGWAPLSPGLDAQGVAAALRDLWKDTHLSCFTVTSCLRSPALIVRHFRFPSLNDDELASALSLEAEEVLQLDPGEIAMDWHEDVVEATAGDSRGREGILVAVPQQELFRHRSILEAAGLVPVVVDVGCTALGNVYMGLRGDECKEHAVCLVNLAGRTADLAILFDGNAMYPRCIMDVGDSEARDRHLADSLTDVLKYYEFKLRRDPVSDLVITGQAPDMERLCENVQRRVGLPVSIWDPCQDMPVTSSRVRRMLDNRPEHGRALTAAIGVAMRR